MEESYASWEKSKHNLIICQKCHSISVLEGNKLLFARYIKGAINIKQEHGRLTPWNKCVDCHFQDTSQGAVSMRKSYGHAKHVFMLGLSCSNCHTGELHSFSVDHTNCQRCHPDRVIHGMGTAGTYCLNCHNFKETSSMLVHEERCFKCHTDIPTTGIMSKIKCYECHIPHTRLRLKSSDCLGSCHGNETRVGQHGQHINKYSMECLDCHKPHIWTIGKNQAKGLCDKCHKMKDPSSFIY